MNGRQNSKTAISNLPFVEHDNREPKRELISVWINFSDFTDIKILEG